MKIKIMANKEKQKELYKRLQSESLELSNEDFDVVVVDPNFDKTELIGKNNQDEYVIIKPKDIVYVESFGHDIYCHTINSKYSIKEKLYEIEGLFETHGFIRTHRSYVINKHFIKTIKPTFNTKFILTMKNGDTLEVSRSYYYIFKNRIGL